MASIILFGASGELGSAASQVFSNAGFDILLVGRNREKLTILQQQLSESSESYIEFIQADITVPEQVASVFEKANSIFNQLEYVLNCAGTAVKGSVLDSSLASTQEVLNTNTIGTLNILKYTAMHLEGNGGHIINIASAVVHNAMPMHAVYGMSKCAQIYLSEVAALELSDKGIQVNVVSPGIIQSEPLNMWLQTEQGRAYTNNIPKHSISSAHELSKLILNVMLLRDPSFTGNVISPDGGFRYYTNQSK